MRLLAIAVVLFASIVPGAAAKRPPIINFLAHCKVSHTAADDPIVYPRQPGRSHQHTFFGNRRTSAFSTLESLRGSETTCSRPSDSAAYWVPTLYRAGREVRPTEAVAYYTLRQFSSTRAYPAGLKIVAGDAHARKAQSLDIVWWNCGAFGGVKRRATVPRQCPDHLELHVRFPDCWDGRRLDSRDHRSHVAYQSRERCPRTHPVRLPSFILIVSYPLRNAQGVTLVSGGQLTGHADFFNSWDQRELERIVRDCGRAKPRCQRAPSSIRKAPTLAERCVPRRERTRAVEFRASDGVRIRGVLLGTGTTGVVLGHQAGGSLCDWLPFARVLAKNGYRALAMDFRGYPSSRKGRGLASTRYDRDFLGAAKLLRTRGVRRIVLVGASMGGTAALVAGSRLADVAAVASFSGPAQFGSLDGRAAVSSLRAPTLLMAGEGDGYFPDDARTLYEASASPQKRLELRPTQAHGSRLLEGRDGAASRRITLDFFAAARG